MATTEEFIGKAMGDFSGFMSVLMATMGDKLGLFRALAAGGPATPAELATRAEVNERYAREWLGGMACAGYVDYDPARGSFSLPAGHVPVLAQEGGPMFFGGAYQEGLGSLPHLPRVIESFRKGGGVPSADYGEEFWCGLSRFTRGWFDNHLVQEWIPAVPRVQAKLTAGGTLADIGCGHGRAVVKLAEAFPASTFVGYDVLETNIVRARAYALEAGVGGRAKFETLDASKKIPGGYDVVTTFDVVHDAADPAGLLRSIKGALAPGGTYLCLDINCSDRLEQMAGPLGTMFHGFSLMYCMTTSLAVGGAGLGTCGLHEKKLRELAAPAGFGEVTRVPLENPFNSLYELRV